MEAFELSGRLKKNFFFWLNIQDVRKIEANTSGSSGAKKEGNKLYKHRVMKFRVITICMVI